MSKSEALRYIITHTSSAARAMAVMEEAAELIQAASKLTRANGEIFNPTSMETGDAVDNFVEEVVDLCNALWAYGLEPDTLASLAKDENNQKLERWAERIKKELEG